MALTSLLSSSSSLQASSGSKVKTLVFCSEGSPNGKFNPQFNNTAIENDAIGVPLYNRLVEFKLGSTEIEPGLAERWTIDDSEKIYDFHLRRGVKWHSNKHFKPSRELNADDVIFSFMRQKDPNHPYHNVSGGNYQSFVTYGMNTLIDKIEKVDDYTVRFVLNRPDSIFLSLIAMGCASILSAEYADILLKRGKPEQIDLDPIGTGPFQLIKYQKDSRILYNANINYWEGKPKIDRLIFSITPDATVRYAKLQKNECQVMSQPNPPDIDNIRKNKQVVLLEQPGMNVGFMAYNTEKNPLGNIKVRQALTMAINKDDIIESVYQNKAQKATNIIPPTLWGYNSEIKDYPYDPNKAKALLQEAGFPRGFSINLWAMPVQRPYNPNARRMAEMIQFDWAKIGVKANIVSYNWGEYITRMARGEHEALLIGFNADISNPDGIMGEFSCSNNKTEHNLARWCNKDFDDLLMKARVSSDLNVRTQLYKKAQVIMHEQLPVLNIAHSTVYVPIRKEVIGYVMDPLGHNNFKTVDINN
ncbi:MAG: ABC transporter substrate-binding protein [Candidatus Liberibacter europaeus]|uniref:ABC transporter substrate-binding protein n=1 Tax=Candidatus Liberibacter europaeus TaxID=744859 RepID=A0A2T4VXI4_9HYPH|nr:MAG: ABC transporter substrate-binding protein [Candidatus Liberibacter europaeus]